MPATPQYGTVAGTRAINPRGNKTEDQVAEFLVEREGELTLPLRLAGVTLPLTFEAAPQLFTMIQMGAQYGAAAMLEGGSTPGQSPDQMAASAGYYAGEYARILGTLQALTAAQLLALGAVIPAPSGTVYPIPKLLGLAPHETAQEGLDGAVTGLGVRWGGWTGR